MASTDPIVKVEKLRKYYGGKLVLDIPHLELDKGDIYALVGPNGSGKTTLLKIIGLLERPEEGNIYYSGNKVDYTPDNIFRLRREMTLVMQDPVLFKTTVYKNVAYGLKMRSVGKKIIDSEVSKALELVGLPNFQGRKASSLSSGEAQRVAIARAIVLKPKLLLLDEPTANVDKMNTQAIELLLKKLHQTEGTTIVLTTHDLSQAYRMTTKVISLLDGKMIGVNPENVFYGTFAKVNGKCAVVNVAPNVSIEVQTYNGRNTGIYIDPKDVQILYKPIYEEGWNCFKGQIVSITFEDNYIRLVIDSGIEMVAVVKREKFTPIFNRDVYVAFKKSDVNVF